MTSTAASLTRYATVEALATQTSGWTMTADGFVHVKQPDSFTAMTVRIER